MLGRMFARSHPFDTVVKETKRFTGFDEAIRSSSDFQFVLGQGSGRDGYDTLTIEGSGASRLVFRAKDTTWHEAKFVLAKDMVEALRAELVAISFGTLHRQYTAQVNDGTQWFVRVRVGAQRKGVFLDNHFPTPVVRLSEFVRTTIVEPRLPDIEASRERPFGAPVEREFWEEDEPKYP